MIVDEAYKLPEAAKQMFGKNLCMDDIREVAYYLEREHQTEEARILRTVLYDALHVVGFTTKEYKSDRLKAMEETNDGFELAQIDLDLRGPGEVYGVRQSGGSRYAFCRSERYRYDCKY